MPTYMILQGVRRSVAANATGMVDIAAIIHRPGEPGLLARVPLSELFSPKTSVLWDYRYSEITNFLDENPSTELAPVTVAPVSEATAGQLTPLPQVALA